MENQFIEIMNDNISEKEKKGKGRKLTAKTSTFNLNDGKYKATITNAFWYKSDDGRDRVSSVVSVRQLRQLMRSILMIWLFMGSESAYSPLQTLKRYYKGLMNTASLRTRKLTSR